LGGGVRPDAAPLPGGYDADWEHDVPIELAGFELEAVGSVTKCAAFWRTFAKRPNVMGWINNGYKLLWETAALTSREIPNAPSAFALGELAIGAIKEMVEAGALTRLPKIPTTYSDHTIGSGSTTTLG
jgi:hypothetical protein